MSIFPARKLLRRLTAIAWLLVVATGAIAAPWPHESSDVPPDPAIRWGRLDNGLRYAIRHNAEPAGRVYLILQVAVGSVHERDDQRGYAHFVEHMMFRGTRKYPENTLVGFLQHEGLAMGADTSAFTNYTTTFYNLDLPRNSPEKIALGLSILRDFSDGAIIAKAAVKREARVIASERRTRQSSASAVGEALTSYLYPGSLLTKRSPIGTQVSVEEATPAALQEFYRTWYRPSRMTVIAVGDADPDLLERLIKEAFASLKPATPTEPPEPNLALNTGPEEIQARFFPNSTPGGTTTLLYTLSPMPSLVDTRDRRSSQVAETAGFAILSNRLAEITRLRATEIGNAQAGWSYEYGAMRQAFVRVDTRPDIWRGAVRLAEQEVRRVLAHGFTPDEVKLQAEVYRNGLAEGVRTAASRQSAQLAQSLRNSLENNFVLTSPETDLELASPAVVGLTSEACLAAFRRLWAPANRRLAVIGSYPTPLTDREVRAAYEDSTYASFFTEKDKKEIEPFDYTDFGPPGTIKVRGRDERVDVTFVEFANGVRANLKQTDYEAGRVYLRIRLGRGLASEPPDQPGLGAVTEGAFPGGGLGRYDNIELGRRLAGDTLGLTFSVEEDGFFLMGFASPDKFEKLLQVITAFLVDPAFRPEGFQATMGRLQSAYPSLNREPVQFLRAVCPTVLAGGDLRYGVVPPDRLAQRKLEEVVAWLKPVLERGSMEVGVAGDLQIETTLAALARTLGALPPRGTDPKPDPARRPALPPESFRHTWLLESSEAGKAAVHLYWPGVDDDDFRTTRRIQVLAEILNDRLRVKIREELGATYGSVEGVWGSEVWRGYGYLFVEIETSPALADRVAALTRRIAGDIAAKGVTQDEFERAIEPRVATLKQELRNNGYWIHHVLCRMQENPSRVSWPLTRNSDYQEMTRNEVNEVARRFLGGDRVYLFTARPK
jgi:zinc protease